MSSEPQVDEAAAAVIAAGMKAVAEADGDVHPQELALIAAFESDVGSGAAGDAVAALNSAEVRDVYLRSLLMVALADGVISDEEEAVIRALAADLGFDDAAVDAATLAVKRQFLSTFSGVTVFRESAVRIAAELGLSEEDLAESTE
jgi:tellurite resistance protein